MKTYLTLFLLGGIVFSKLYGQSFQSTILNKEPIYSQVAVLHDYDGDGDLDIVVAEKDPDRLIWLENDSTKQFPVSILVDTDITRPYDVDVADLDLDGDMDFLVCTGARPGFDDGELVWFQRQSDDSYIKWSIEVGKRF